MWEPLGAAVEADVGAGYKIGLRIVLFLFLMASRAGWWGSSVGVLVCLCVCCGWVGVDLGG